MSENARPAHAVTLTCARCQGLSPHFCHAIIEGGKLRIQTACTSCGLKTIGRKRNLKIRELRARPIEL